MAFYSRGERYLRSFDEIIEMIGAAIEARKAAVTLRMVGCTGGDYFPHMIKLIKRVFSASPDTRAEHLLSLPSQNPAEAARTLASLTPLLQYRNYQMLYTERSLEDRDHCLFPDFVWIDLREPQEGSWLRDSFCVAFSGTGLSQCIQYEDENTGCFFEVAYTNLRRQYENALLVDQNLSALGERLAGFESDGEICLFKADICYHFIPPQVYESFFARLGDGDKQALLARICAKEIPKAQIGQTIESLCKTLAQRNATNRSNRNRLICSRDGLVTFAKTGRLLDSLFVGLPPFSRQERLAVFLDLRKRMSDPEDAAEILITDQPLLADRGVVDVNREQGVLLDFNGELEPGMCQNVLIRHQPLCELFFDYAENYFPQKYAYDGEKAAAFLDAVVRRLSRG